MAGVFRALMPKSGGADAAEESVERRGSFFSALSERIDVELQMAGNLWKKDTAGSSSWNVRYFVIKDGFLLYYPEAKTPMMTFNMHPKGVIPLDGVEIETERSGPNKTLQSAFRITHPSFGSKSLLLCAKDDAERAKWVDAITSSVTITYSQVIKHATDMEAMKRALHEAQLKAANAMATLNTRQDEFSAKHDELAAALARNKELEAGLARAEIKIGALTAQLNKTAPLPDSWTVSLPQTPASAPVERVVLPPPSEPYTTKQHVQGEMPAKLPPPADVIGAVRPQFLPPPPL